MELHPLEDTMRKRVRIPRRTLARESIAQVNITKELIEKISASSDRCNICLDKKYEFIIQNIREEYGLNPESIAHHFTYVMGLTYPPKHLKLYLDKTKNSYFEALENALPPRSKKLKIYKSSEADERLKMEAPVLLKLLQEEHGTDYETISLELALISRNQIQCSPAAAEAFLETYETDPKANETLLSSLEIQLKKRKRSTVVCENGLPNKSQDLGIDHVNSSSQESPTIFSIDPTFSTQSGEEDFLDNPFSDDKLLAWERLDRRPDLQDFFIPSASNSETGHVNSSSQESPTIFSIDPTFSTQPEEEDSLDNPFSDDKLLIWERLDRGFDLGAFFIPSESNPEIVHVNSSSQESQTTSTINPTLSTQSGEEDSLDNPFSNDKLWAWERIDREFV
jgi:hypothetical protein